MVSKGEIPCLQSFHRLPDGRVNDVNHGDSVLQTGSQTLVRTKNHPTLEMLKFLQCRCQDLNIYIYIYRILKFKIVMEINTDFCLGVQIKSLS